VEYSDYYQDALAEPMKWFRMDADFMRDKKVRGLAVLGGWAAIGRYVALIALLAEADGHTYDLSDDHGWRFLCADMSCGGGAMGEEELREFVQTLYDLKLIDREMWDESRKVAMNRLMREVENMAKDVARGRLSAERARAGKKGQK
jgi:hypothetical protein